MPSVSDQTTSDRLDRYGYTILPARLAKTNNIDVAPSGQLALLSEEAIYILTPALGLSPLLKSNDKIRSHHDPSEDIPLYTCPILIKDIHHDVSKAGSGRDAYMPAFEQKFLDAKWSPALSGPNESPILAALTTQSQIILYVSPTNQYTGPWKQIYCLDGGPLNHITSIVWIETDTSQAWLIAGTRRGTILSWLIQGSRITKSDEHALKVEEIYAMYWSRTEYMAMVTSEGLIIANVVKSDTKLQFHTDSMHAEVPQGSYINLAHWQNSQLVFCTPGQVHHYNAATRVSSSILLEGTDDDDVSCSMRPATAIAYDIDREVWNVTVQDGSEFYITPTDLQSKTEFIRSTSFLTPPNEAIGILQRKVEATRGLYAKVADNSGLTFTCHDANSIASWAYFRDPKCQFELSITKAPKPAQDLQFADSLIAATLEGDYLHLRTLVAYFMRSSRKVEVATLVMHYLERASKEKTQLHGAMRLSAWIQHVQLKEAKDRVRNQVHTKLLDLVAASNLSQDGRKLQNLLKGNASIKKDLESVAFCNLLSKLSQKLNDRLDDDELIQAANKLDAAIKSCNVLKDTSKEDAGEKCPACQGRISLDGDWILQAKCEKGHSWKRCSTTFAILTSSYNMICSICSRESIRPEDATSSAQRDILAQWTICRICRGKLFS